MRLKLILKFVGYIHFCLYSINSIWTKAVQGINHLNDKLMSPAVLLRSSQKNKRTEGSAIFKRTILLFTETYKLRIPFNFIHFNNRRAWMTALVLGLCRSVSCLPATMRNFNFNKVQVTLFPLAPLHYATHCPASEIIAIKVMQTSLRLTYFLAAPHTYTHVSLAYGCVCVWLISFDP